MKKSYISRAIFIFRAIRKWAFKKMVIDPIVERVVKKRIAEIRQEAEVEFFEKGFHLGEQSQRDSDLAERGGGSEIEGAV